ncbi:MAG: hypothetical protein ABI771_03530 [Betaproteobacteria bacterium]
MTHAKPRIAAGIACMLLVLGTGCASNAKKAAGPAIEKDVMRTVKLSDGTTCTEPAGLADSRQSEGATQLKALIESAAGTDEVLKSARELKPKGDEIEAVYFDACRAYSKSEIKKDAFERNRTVYLDLRQLLLGQRMKKWQEKADGIADAGKLCLVALPDTDPDHRSFTRVMPPDTTVSDCAQLAIANGSAEILLGCTKGNWENLWAKNSIAVARAGAGLSDLARGRAPDPNCGWR